MLCNPKDKEEYGWIEEIYNVTPCASFLKELTEIEWYSALSEKYKQELESFSIEVENNYKETSQTPEELRKKLAFRQTLHDLITKYSEEGNLNWQFEICVSGSSVSGLGGRNSDVDLCLCIPAARNAFPECAPDYGLAKINILQIVRHMIVLADFNGNNIGIKSMVLIKAGIPLLKIDTNDDVEIDLSVCVEPFVSGVHNSFLIKGYTEVDPRFGPLCMFVKGWANKSGLKNPLPTGGKFNSYAITMLLIHFLQCGVVPPVLPNLQKRFPELFAQSEEVYPLSVDFNCKIEDPTPDYPKNGMNIAQLFITFLLYYRNFNFREFCISMKDSQLKTRGNDSSLNAAHTKALVYIEDPIDMHNPGRTCRDFGGALQIFRKASKIFEDVVLKSTGFPSMSDLLQSEKSDE